MRMHGLKHGLRQGFPSYTFTFPEGPVALVNILCRLAAGSDDVLAGSLLRLAMCTLMTASLLNSSGNPGACTRSIERFCSGSELRLQASYMQSPHRVLPHMPCAKTRGISMSGKCVAQKHGNHITKHARALARTA